jgi:hypothetical protein
MIFFINLVNMVLGAFVGQQLWAWHVAPVFGLAVLTLWQVFALRIVISFFTFGAADSTAVLNAVDTKDAQRSLKQVLAHTMIYVILLAFGYLAKIAQ